MTKIWDDILKLLVKADPQSFVSLLLAASFPRSVPGCMGNGVLGTK